MLDKAARAIMGLKLGRPVTLEPRKATVTTKRLKSYSILSPRKLKALRKYAVKENEILNPYGTKGAIEHKESNTQFLRAKAMQRKRLKLKRQKEVALEAHELQQLARENATAAMQTLIEISKNKRAPEATRIAASAVILDRGYGKASQTSITANVTNGKASDITADELDKRVKQTLKRVEELTTRKGEAGTSQKGPVDLRKYN